MSNLCIQANPKQDVLNCLFKTKVVAIIRLDQSSDLISVSQALFEGGVRFVEITMTVPGALKSIEQAADHFGDRMFVGAGTVLTSDDANDVISAGASFVVSPVFSKSVINVCNSNDTVVAAGCMTPTEIYEAWNYGADIVKVFPCDIGGVKFIRNLKGPLPDINIMPTGGVNLDTICDFVDAGVCAVGVGGALVNQQLIETGQYDKIAGNASEFIRKIAK